MAFCEKCGTQINEDVKFCPGCGAETNQTRQEPPAEDRNDFKSKFANLTNTADETASIDEKDIADNKGISVLSYLGPLVFIPMFARKESKYARFHANQGLTLFIANSAYAVVQAIFVAILRAIFPWNWSYGYFGGRGFVYNALSTILSLVWIPFTVLAVLGFVNTLRGKAKALPVIGKFKILK